MASEPIHAVTTAAPTLAGGDPLAEPSRVAAVDVGSNAIRYVVAEVSAAGTYTEIESERLAVRLGKDVFTRERRLSSATLDEGVAALTHIRRRLDDLGIAHYRAVATSAVRESRNGGAFVERIRRECGIHLETISGSEEARLVWIAIRSRVDLGDARWFSMDLGGGSVEVSVVDREGILWSESHTLGSVRLLQAFQENRVAASGHDYRELLERYVHVLKVPRAVTDWGPAGAIATGGNIEALAELAGAPRDDAGVARLTIDALHEVMSRLTSMTFEERVDRLGLRVDRADVILPAAVVYERVAELAGAKEILVPGVGVKEGLVLDLVDQLRNQAKHSDRRVSEIRAAAVALGRRFQFDEAHGHHVADLSLSLFDQLAVRHGLGDRARTLLMVGALLHDIGQFVSYQRHHKHSMYLIENSELPGLSPRDILLVALLARYHRRAEPKSTHLGYQDLDPSEQDIVRKLASILRVADALDRGHVRKVESLVLHDRTSGFELEITSNGSLSLERWSLRRKGRLFERTFGKSLVVPADREE